MEAYIVRHNNHLSLEKFGCARNHLQEDRWVTVDPSIPETAGGDVTGTGHRYSRCAYPTDRPKACISRGLIPEVVPPVQLPFRDDPVKPKNNAIRFVLIVEGRQKAEIWTTVTEGTHAAVAAAIVYELTNDFAIVFSCAMCYEDIERIRRSKKPIKFQRATTFDHMLRTRTISYEDNRDIMVLC